MCMENVHVRKVGFRQPNKMLSDVASKTGTVCLMGSTSVSMQWVCELCLRPDLVLRVNVNFMKNELKNYVFLEVHLKLFGIVMTFGALLHHSAAPSLAHTTYGCAHAPSIGQALGALRLVAHALRSNEVARILDHCRVKGNRFSAVSVQRCTF